MTWKTSKPSEMDMSVHLQRVRGPDVGQNLDTPKKYVEF